jgi:arylsulfatase A-like enzyme
MRLRHLCAGTLVLAACAAPPATPPLRLVEHRDVAIDWPRLDVDLPPGNPEIASLGDLPRTGAVAEIQMHRGAENRDSRAALLAPSGSAYRFRLGLPAQPTLRLALGYVLPGEGSPPRNLTYVIKIASPGGAPETILEETLRIDPEGAWRDREIALDAWSGRDVELAFAVRETFGPGHQDPLEPPEPLWGAWATPEVEDRRRRHDGWDVILISLDTLRADHLGCYGYARPTSPNIDALAAGGVRFATAVSQSPWTRPSHRSMLSGLYPSSWRGFRALPLALLLWHAGYRTAAITGGGQVSPAFGFHSGFESYRVEFWIHDVEGVADWLEAGRERPDFLFLHTYEIHDPYTHTRFTDGLPPGRLDGAFSETLWRSLHRDLSDDEEAYVEALYDGGVAYTDEKLGLLFDELRRRGLLDRTIVALTSDHGEQLWEHGSWRHGTTLYDHQLLVPLILHLPPELRQQLEVVAGRVVDRQVELIDLYPTLLDLLGLELPHRVQGRSLRPWLARGEPPPRTALSENVNIRRLNRKSLRTERFKFIHSIPRKAFSRPDAVEHSQLFDLVEDPGESTDLADEYAELVTALRRELARRTSGRGAEGLEVELPEGVSPELAEQLRALGYLGD